MKRFLSKCSVVMKRYWKLDFKMIHMHKREVRRKILIILLSLKILSILFSLSFPIQTHHLIRHVMEEDVSFYLLIQYPLIYLLCRFGQVILFLVKFRVLKDLKEKEKLEYFFITNQMYYQFSLS